MSLTREEEGMKKSIFAMVLMALMIIVFSGTTALHASSGQDADDPSFAAEGAHAYDNLKKSIEQSTQNGYDQLFGTTKQTDNIIGGVDYGKKIWTTLFYILDVLTSIYRFAVVTSISIGILVFLLASKNKKIKKFALYFLIIAIPVILTIFRYGIPVFYTDFIS